MKMEKVSRRKEQGAETKKRLYEVARKLFIAYGIDDVSVDAIVEAAGVSKGTFYVHFESKDILLSTLISDYVDMIDINYETFLKTIPADTPASDILLSLAAKIFDMIEHTIGYENIKTLYKVQLTKVDHVRTVTSYTRALYQMFGDVLEKGINRGEFKIPVSVDELSRHLIMAIRGLTYEWCVRYPDFDLKEQSLTHFKILLTGIINNS